VVSYKRILSFLYQSKTKFCFYLLIFHPSNRLKNSLRRKFDFISLTISTIQYWCFTIHFDSIINNELMRWRKENWKRKNTYITTFLESSWGIIFACIYICVCILLSNYIFNHSISRSASTNFSSFADSVIMVFTSITYALLFTMGKFQWKNLYH